MYDIKYPLSFKDLNKMLVSLSLKYSIEDPCINCFRETKEEIMVDNLLFRVSLGL